MRSPRIAVVAVALAVIASACASDSASDAATAATDAPAEQPTRNSGSTDLTEANNAGRASVPLEDIIFDTFGSGSLTLAEATPEQILGLLDAIVPIDEPTYDTDGSWLDDEDLIIGHVDQTGQARAWPHRILNFHEIVNDVLDDEPALISYCPLCRSGVIYSRLVDGDDDDEMVLSFGNSSALYENDLVMVDRQTGTYWWQVRGIGLVGALTDVELRPLPSRTTTWAKWSSDHPNTLVLTRESGGGSYTTNPFRGYEGTVDDGRFPFPVSELAAEDQRLDPSALVIAIVGENDNVVAVATNVESPTVLPVGDGIQVWLDGEGGAVAFNHHESLRVVSDGGNDSWVLSDNAGGRFDAAGRSIDGGDDLKGEPSRSSFWFAIVASFPDVTIVG